jgi:hypothetical protein
MLRRVFAAAAVVAAALTPRPVLVKFRIGVQSGLPVYAMAAQRAIERGLFADSLIRRYVPGELDSSLPELRVVGSDTLRLRPSPQVALVRARISGSASRLSVCVLVMNIIAQPIAVDTFTSDVAVLDSVLAAHGARYAQLLARPTWSRGPSNDRCN